MADDTSGKMKHVGGKIQEEVGELLGDRKMRRRGRLTQAEGEAEQDMDRALDEAEDAAVRKSVARHARKRES
jgi:uncharacterized protein YjbJ (UPF0337 family)